MLYFKKYEFVLNGIFDVDLAEYRKCTTHITNILYTYIVKI